MPRLPWHKRTTPELPPRASQVKFEVSPEAANVIRERGGQLWIWPSPGTRSAYATTEPPGDIHEWTGYRQAGFVVHVDDEIVPPERWAVAVSTAGSRHLLARWIGTDRDEDSGRMALVEKPEPPAPPYRWVLRGVALLVVVWLLGSLVLELAGVHRWWLLAGNPTAEVFHLLVAPLAAAIAWVWHRVGRAGAAAPSSGDQS